MRSLPFKKYRTCELKSKIIDYKGYSVKICAYRASGTTLFDLRMMCESMPSDRVAMVNQHALRAATQFSL